MKAPLAHLVELGARAKQGAPGAGAALARALAQILCVQPCPLGPAELAHADAILARLTERAELSLRRELALSLADSPAAPRGVINQLARDDLAVAEPVLRRSPALTEDDLIAIIRQRGGGHQRALARRRNTPASVIDALIECGDEGVLVSLAHNQHAHFSPQALCVLVTQARQMRALLAPLTERFDLSPTLLTQLYFCAPAPLKSQILKRSDRLDPTLVEAAMTENRARILQAAPGEKEHERNAREAVASLAGKGGVNEALLTTLANEKRRREFTYAFGYLAGVDRSGASLILDDQNYEPLTLACRAMGIARQTFAKIVFCLQRAGRDKAKALRILDLYGKVPGEAAERMMRFWRMRASDVETGAERHQAIAPGYVPDADDEPLLLQR